MISVLFYVRKVRYVVEAKIRVVFIAYTLGVGNSSQVILCSCNYWAVISLVLDKLDL